MSSVQYPVTARNRNVWKEVSGCLWGGEKQMKAGCGLWKMSELSGDSGIFWKRLDNYEGEWLQEFEWM